MAMIDMALDAKEAKEEQAECGTMPDAPKYPYGLQLCLNDEALEKLGMTALPTVGGTMTLTAVVKVTGVRSYQTQTEKEAGEPAESSENSVDLQITAMELATAGKSAAETLYGKK